VASSSCRHRSSFFIAFGKAQILITLHRALNEGIQFRVVEGLPPLDDLPGAVGLSAQLRLAPVRRRGGVRWMIVRADGATAGQDEQARNEGAQLGSLHKLAFSGRWGAAGVLLAVAEASGAST
jgi:hypothetical protein